MIDEKTLTKLDDILNVIVNTNPRSRKRAETIRRELLNEYFTAERCISFITLYDDITPEKYDLRSASEVKKLLDEIERAIN